MSIQPATPFESNGGLHPWNAGPEPIEPIPLPLRRLPDNFEESSGKSSDQQCAEPPSQRTSEFEGLLLDVMARFINLPASEVDREIEDALERVCSLLGLECARVWMDSTKDRDSFRLTHQCLQPHACGAAPASNLNRSGAVGSPNSAALLPEETTESKQFFPWITAMARRGKTIVFSKVAELPEEAKKDKLSLEHLGIRSAVVVPFLVEGEVLGFASFEMVQQERQWPRPRVRKLELIAEVFANANARKRSEQALAESEARFRMVADSAPVLIWMAGTDKLCHFFNQPWLEFTGRKLEQELGEGWAEGVHPEDRERCIQLYCKSFDARQPFTMQYRLRRKDGQYRWILDKGVPRFESNGNFAGYIGSCVDITEEKENEEALKRSYAEIKQLKDRLHAETDYLKSEIKVTQAHGQIIGKTRTFKRVLHQVEQVAPVGCSVLISGETGTGKELVAQEIHRLSPRKERLMVLVNCAALPSPLVESELFGRERGAYTGALSSQVGRFEVANGSTIFLDEVGELSVEVQAKLLRVLQEGEFQRLGSPKTHKVDVRVLAATNRDLADDVRKGKFREDLYYRLRVFPIEIPPLRERVEDIPLMVFAFLEEFATRMGKKITKVPRKTMDLLQAHSWPGNIRELRNVIEHGVILSAGDSLIIDSFGGAATREGKPVTLADAERDHILKTLESTRWRIKGPHGAASRLALQPSTLYSRMQKLNIPHRRQKDEISTHGIESRPL